MFTAESDFFWTGMLGDGATINTDGRLVGASGLGPIEQNLAYRAAAACRYPQASACLGNQYG